MALGLIYGNRLGIADQDIPLDYSVGATEQTVATPLRGGAVVVFPIQPIRAVTGTAVPVVGEAPVVPAYGELVVTAEGRRFDSPIGAEGDIEVNRTKGGDDGDDGPDPKSRFKTVCFRKG